MSVANAFEMLKSSPRSNLEKWLKDTSIISYGVVTSIVTPGIVKVERIVRDSIARKFCTVTLLNVSATQFEQAVNPTVGDLVLLLFVDRYNRNMFDLPKSRDASDEQNWGIEDNDAVGYNSFAGVGILMSPAKGFAETVMRYYSNGGVPTASLRSQAKWQAVFKRELSMVFDALPDNGSIVDRLISLTFGTSSPVSLDYRAKVTTRHGFSVRPDKTLEDVDATVTEEFSPNAPIVKDIQAGQTIKIGKGKSPAGDPSGSDVDVDAPVNVTIGSKADVTVTSDSGLSLEFEKAVVHKTGSTYKIEATGKITISGQDAIEILSSAASLVKLGNSVGTLGALIDSLCDTLKNTPPMLGVAGTPALASISPNPAFALAIKAFKAQWDQVFN